MKCKLLVHFTKVRTELEGRGPKSPVEVNEHSGAILYSSKLISAFGEKGYF